MKNEYSPYSHTCVDRPHLPCDACDWAERNTPKSWSQLNSEERALELAKTAMGWNDLTQEQQEQKAQELTAKAEQFKGAL